MSAVGGFDVVSGTPTSLALLAAVDVSDNIGIVSEEETNVIFGDLNRQAGEGALSILLGAAANVFGFEIAGANGGQFLVEFFAADGSSIGSFTQTASESFFGFRTTEGSEIWGVTLTNTDPAGIGYDTVTFDSAATGIPEPATLALLGMGLFGLGASRRRAK